MKPLLHDDDLTDDERALLRSARGDSPSPALRGQTLAALGLGAAALGSSVAAHAAGKAAVSAGAGAAGAGGAGGTLTTVALAKWLGAGALIGAVATSGVVAVVAIAGGTPTSPVEVGARTLSDPSYIAASPPRAAVALPPAGDEAVDPLAPLRPVDDLPNLAAPGRAEATLAPGRTSTAPPVPARDLATGDPRAGAAQVPGSAAFSLPAGHESRIAAEVASLDGARAALGARDPVGAIARLDAHGRRFPGGTLEPEAILLRVRALVALGRIEEARGVAARFIGANPGSPQAARLSALVGR